MVLQNVEKAQIKVRMKKDNVVGKLRPICKNYFVLESCVKLCESCVKYSLYLEEPDVAGVSPFAPGPSHVTCHSTPLCSCQIGWSHSDLT